VKIADDLRDAFLRYIDTAYALRDQSLVDERRRLLLEGQGNLFAPLMLEPVLPYDGVASVREAASQAGVDARDLGDVIRAVFGVTPDALADVKLRKHQAAALTTHFAPGIAHNPVVTSGTGSGKTESFLIPLLNRITAEKRSTAALAPIHEWWDLKRQTDNWQPTRTVGAIPAAVRSVILYPTNALVEDLSRRDLIAQRLLGVMLYKNNFGFLENHLPYFPEKYLNICQSFVKSKEGMAGDVGQLMDAISLRFSFENQNIESVKLESEIPMLFKELKIEYLKEKRQVISELIRQLESGGNEPKLKEALREFDIVSKELYSIE